MRNKKLSKQELIAYKNYTEKLMIKKHPQKCYFRDSIYFHIYFPGTRFF